MKHIYIIVVLALLVSCSKDSVTTPVLLPDSGVEIESELSNQADDTIVDEEAVSDISAEIEEEIEELERVEAEVEMQEQQEVAPIQAEEEPTIQEPTPSEIEPEVVLEQKVEVVDEEVVSEPANTRQQRTGSSGY